LLEFDSWKKFARLTNKQKKLLHMANQAKLQSFHTASMYHFGILIPCNHKHGVELDQLHGNHLWRKSEVTELDSIDEYNTFHDVGKGTTPNGYKKIQYHIIYAVKHDLGRKAKLVADGNITETPLTSVYSSVVSLPGLRLCLFLAELNQLEAWSTDIGIPILNPTLTKKCMSLLVMSLIS